MISDIPFQYSPYCSWNGPERGIFICKKAFPKITASPVMDVIGLLKQYVFLESAGFEYVWKSAGIAWVPL